MKAERLVEEAFVCGDADDPVIRCCVGSRETRGSFGNASSASRATSGWVINLIDDGGDVGFEDSRVAIDTPVHDFRICVSERFCASHISRSKQCTLSIAVEGVQGSVGINCSSHRNDVITLSCVPRNGELVGVYGLPDSKNAVNIGVVEPEDGIKSSHREVSHLAPNILMDKVVYVL